MKVTTTLYLLASFLGAVFFSNSFAQTVPATEWAITSGAGNFDAGNSITYDSSGNSYVTGDFYETVTFGSISLTASGNDSDVFVAKFSPTGDVLWAIKLGGTGSETGNEITIDGLGNVYVAGRFSGTSTFGNFTLTGIDTFFVAKITSTVEVEWVKGFGDSSNANSIVADSIGNLVVVGRFENTMTLGSVNLSSAGSSDIFVAKMDSSGNISWANRYGNAGTDQAYSVDLDSSGNIYVSGDFNNTVDFGGTTVTSNGSYDAFALKLNSAGVTSWVKGFGGSGADFGQGVTVDSSGNSYYTGNFGGSIVVGDTSLTSNGNNDIYIVKIDSSGDYAWVKSYGGSAYDIGLNIYASSANNIYVTGAFRNTVSFGTNTLTSEGGPDIFLLKLSDQGSLTSAVKFGSNDFDFGNSVAVDDAENIYLTGYHSGDINFDNVSLTAFGNGDIFVAKLGNSDLGISDVEPQQLSIYPNPVQDKIYFKTNKAIENISIYNMVGQNIIQNSKIENSQLNINYLKSGNYLLQATYKDGSKETLKLIKK